MIVESHSTNVTSKNGGQSRGNLNGAYHGGNHHQQSNRGNYNNRGGRGRGRGGRGQPIYQISVSLVIWLPIVTFVLSTILPPPTWVAIHSKGSMLETPQPMLQAFKQLVIPLGMWTVVPQLILLMISAI